MAESNLRTFVAVVLVVAATACSPSTSWVDEVMTAATAPDDLPPDMEEFLTEVGASDETGGCFGGIMEEPEAGDPVPSPGTSEVTAGSGNDPYTATGARQVPGPNMIRTAPPTEPIYRVVARPADPNEHDPSGKPEGGATGPIPQPRILTSTTDTTVPDVTVPEPGDDPAEQCG